MAFLDELRNSMGGGSPTKGAAKSVDPNDLKDLGLGGLPSFLGTRDDAAVGKRGDAQIAATLTDSLPGYFNPETRDYVPWYVDLFDGGGINRSAGMLDAGSNAQGQAVGGVMSPMRPTARPEGLLTPGLGSQLSDMEMANRNRASQMTPGLGSQLSDMEMANRNRAAQMASGLGSQLSDMEMANRNRASQQAMPASQQAIPASGGNMAINTPAAQGRDQMIADQQMLAQEQAIKKHPRYSEYVDFLNRYGLASSPGLGSQFFDMELANRNGAYQGDLASLTPDPPAVRDKWSGRMFVDERGKPFDTELWQPEPNQPGRFRGTDYERPPQNPTITMPQEPTVPSLSTPSQNNAEYQEFVEFLSDDGGFTRELQNPEWMQRAFKRYMQSRAN